MIGAIDIGGSKFAVGMVDGGGRVLARAEEPAAPERGREDGVARILAMVRATAGQARERLEGVGIGCTGPVDPVSGVLGPNAFLPGWEGLNLVQAVEEALGVTAAMENDADAAALAEQAWGAGRGAKRFIYLTVSTGIGGGLVMDGELYRGADGAHPEIGHHVIDPAGPRCFCGARGCWEVLAGGPALARRGARPSAREVCERAGQGDAAAQEAVRQEGVYLGLGLANLITLFMPDVIALGGGVMQSWQLFQSTAEETIRSMCGLVPYQKTRLVRAALGLDAGLIGAAQAWHQRWQR